jgi:hypothetical protein
MLRSLFLHGRQFILDSQVPELLSYFRATRETREHLCDQAKAENGMPAISMKPSLRRQVSDCTGAMERTASGDARQAVAL